MRWQNNSETEHIQLKKICLLLVTLIFIFSLSSCDMGDVTDQLQNIAQSNDEDVLGVKNAYYSNDTDITYGEAFDDFFAYPTWKSFVGTKEGTDEDGDGEPDTKTENVKVVEFTGYCTYAEQEVKARIQFTLDDENGTFQPTYLAFNEVPQNMLMLYVLMEEILESASPGSVNTDDENNDDIVVTTTAKKTTTRKKTTTEQIIEVVEPDYSLYDETIYEYMMYCDESSDYYYYLFDIDGNGVVELIIDNGQSIMSEEYRDVYTIENGKLVHCGIIGGKTQYSLSYKNDSLYQNRGIQGALIVEEITLKDGKLSFREIFNDYVDEYVNYGTDLYGYLYHEYDYSYYEELSYLEAPCVYGFYDATPPMVDGMTIRADWDYVDGADGYEVYVFETTYYAGGDCHYYDYYTDTYDTYYEMSGSVPMDVELIVRAYAFTEDGIVYSDWSNYAYGTMNDY